MSSQDHTYLCKALLACLNQAVEQIQVEGNFAVRLLTKPLCTTENRTANVLWHFMFRTFWFIESVQFSWEPRLTAVGEELQG